MIRVHFLAPQIPLPSIETQAIRLHRGLCEFQPDRIQAEITFLPPGATAETLASETAGWMPAADILVVVKHHLFENFERASRDLVRAAREHGTLIVSHPCDGVEKGTSSGFGEFTATQSDAVLVLSTAQHEALRRVRAAGDIYQLGHASRVEGHVARCPVGERVENVIWENPVHYNPVEIPDPERRKPYRELENLIRGISERHGARLTIVSAWYPPQPYENWLQTLSTADIAVECKALDRTHAPAQSQKPAVKVLNYLSLGLPVVCDSLPAYRELGEDDQQLLFADTLEEWERQLTRLMEDRALRERLSRSGYQVAQSHRIENVCADLADIFQALVEKRAARQATLP